jgi:hypothetical protein
MPNKRTYKKKNGAKITKRIAKVEKDVKALQKQGDMGCLDTTFSGTLVPNLTLVSLNNMSEGSGIGNREGREIWIKSIEMRLRFDRNKHEDEIPQFIRVMLIRQNYPQSATPAATDVLNTDSYMSLRPLDPTLLAKVTVLKDWTFAINPETDASGNVTYSGGSRKLLTYYRRFKGAGNRVIFQGGGTGTYGKGSLYLATMQSDIAVTGQDNQINGYVRIRYVK